MQASECVRRVWYATCLSIARSCSACSLGVNASQRGSRMKRAAATRSARCTAASSPLTTSSGEHLGWGVLGISSSSWLGSLSTLSSIQSHSTPPPGTTIGAAPLQPPPDCCSGPPPLGACQYQHQKLVHQWDHWFWFWFWCCARRSLGLHFPDHCRCLYHCHCCLAAQPHFPVAAAASR
eukprot:CAMPEP_0202899044 /NCGR_PEP_ID=MMETSP1392-20130828/7390_1 /ASSEMBLY_ACC=CAM_ASM_000868 /TAXON_ID=225041 /ORGANISM="Chlamydomonas chlamydogama, Strain SAG 11-48b" /LENGTH=178 /DNA_ID=CAMNT_0049585131 /DNA_START=585 /DNA_END=1122 /DNA_ORIENTATION=-